MNLQKIFLTLCGAGLSSKAPGTIGTLISLPIGLLILFFLGIETLILVTIFVTIIGIYEIDKYEKKTNTHDSSQIVIDEASGMWISLIISYEAYLNSTYPYSILLYITISFLTFRFFDILKPSIIGRIDRNLKGGMGVMLDDVLAGIASGILTALILELANKLLSS